jgi:pyruvate kinase
VRHTDEIPRQVDDALLSLERCSVGDQVVIVSGSPPGKRGSLNTMHVHSITWA